jgi:hypothetical protein
MMKSKHFPAFTGMITTLFVIVCSKTVNGLYRPSDIGVALAGGLSIYGVTALYQFTDEL